MRAALRGCGGIGATEDCTRTDRLLWFSISLITPHAPWSWMLSSYSLVSSVPHSRYAPRSVLDLHEPRLRGGCPAVTHAHPQQHTQMPKHYCAISRATYALLM